MNRYTPVQRALFLTALCLVFAAQVAYRAFENRTLREPWLLLIAALIMVPGIAQLIWALRNRDQS
jgi:hypothetical protein